MIVLADVRVAVGTAAGLVGQPQEAGEGGRELSRGRFDRDELAVLHVGVEPAQRHGKFWVVLRGGQRVAHLLSDVLVGHGAVALDGGGVGVVRGEERAVGDDHADLQGGRVDPLAAADQRIGEEVRHDLLMAAPVSMGARLLRGEGESFADACPVESRQPCGDRAHAVLGAAHRDAALLLRRAVTRGGTAGVDPVEHPLRFAGPLLRPAALEVGQVGGEDLIDERALLRSGRAHRAGDPVHGRGDDLPSGQGAEHPGHGVDEPAA